MHKLAARIRMHRAEHRIHQGALAQQLGYSRATLSFWENGHVRPSIQAIQKLAQILNIPLEQAIKETE
jgi:transcriptional regulator with XRE-family HTH domain